MGKTFVEKILGADAGTVVFRKPGLVLTHDNTSSIQAIFRKMGGIKVSDPDQLIVVLDHNAPPTNSKLANSYQAIRDFVREQQVQKFFDAGEGICHQLMARVARPGMLIVGSDSHTCTAGAFNSFAAGIDRTEAAGIWKTGETWFKVPGSIKISLYGKLREHVSAKDVALYLIGKLGSNGADYKSIEFWGDGVEEISVAGRMVIANLASEMGAKNAVFPADDRLIKYFRKPLNGIWADSYATYDATYEIDMEKIPPLVACPHHVDNVKTVEEVGEIPIHQALIGTCTNGRLEDLRVAAKVLEGEKVAPGVQLLVAPASKEIYIQAIQEGIVEILLEAGATMLSPSCGPCLGTGQGIPADNTNVVSTANRNFLGRMGNKNASIYLASPETVAFSALTGKLSNPGEFAGSEFVSEKKEVSKVEIQEGDFRKNKNVWNYADIDNLNTDQMFAGNLTYQVSSAEPEAVLPHLFKGFDPAFSENVKQGDILICGENFGCGSSREHPSVGLRFAGVRAVIVKSVARIFYRSAINQGLPVIIHPEAVDFYKPGDNVSVFLEEGKIIIGEREFDFSPLPEKLMNILHNGGLVESIKSEKIE